MDQLLIRGTRYENQHSGERVGIQRKSPTYT